MENPEITKKKIIDRTLSPADIHGYFKQIIKIANSNGDINKYLKGWDFSLYYNLGDSYDFFLKIENDTLKFYEKKEPAAGLIYTISGNDLIKLIYEQYSGNFRYAAKVLNYEGNYHNLLKFRAIQQKVMEEINPSLKDLKKNDDFITADEFLNAFERLKPRNEQFLDGTAKGAELTPDSYRNIALYVEENARKYPDDDAILYEDVKYTHSEYNEWCNRYANFFRNKVGLKKGDVVIVYLINRPEIMFTIVGLSKIGVISSLINTKQRNQQLIHSIQLAPGKAFIIGEELIQPFEDIKDSLNLSEEQLNNLYFIPDKGELKPPEEFKNLYKLVKDGNDEDISNPPTSSKLQAKDPYSYIFTSGTTGLPKAAIITHGHTVGSSYYWADVVIGMEHKDIIYISLPLFHSNAINVGYAAALRYGSTIAISRRFSVSRFWDEIIEFGATCFNYIGEICRYLYNQPPKPTDKKHKVKKIVGNGLKNDMWKNFKKRFGIENIYEFYGATERFCPNFANRFNLNKTVGITGVPYAIIKYDIDGEKPIKDEDSHMIRVDEGEAGLLLGQVDPELFYMYTNEKEDEKKIFRNIFVNGDMYMNTGDLVKPIGFGHIQFIDRLGDTFRWKGENVSTEEVENVINLHPHIKVCSVYGVEIPGTEGRIGMSSMEISVSKPEEFDFDALINIIEKYLPEYSRPKFLRFTSELQTTATLKVQKGKLKKEGYNINKLDDPIYILLPGATEYVSLTKEIYKNIDEQKYRF
ncbi:MAG: long-chain-acyl-CoA synthetase [Promethearchaeota archaeon]